MSSLFVVRSAAGPARDHARGTREQDWWNEHAAFVDELVEQGFIVLGGPFPDDGGSMVVVRSESEQSVRDWLGGDPWYHHGILQLETIQRWEIFIDKRPESR
ncbi:MAG: hypothetical protein KC438_05695 [Thermomicrobiales bacterium]|nr:hypothetical protein [Thermomicrobiales bacterium]MCO5223084.1 YciI family protein [Thermomicrobiales bacterium]